MKAMRTADNGGYSLIELVAALMIFSFGVMGSMELFTVCLQSTSTSLGYTQAVFLAQAVIEETIAEGEVYEGTDSGTFSSQFPRHSWETECEEMDTIGLMKLRVVISWDERGNEKTFEITTLVADRE